MRDAARQALAFVDGRTRADLGHDPMLLRTTVVDQLPGLCAELERALAGE